MKRPRGKILALLLMAGAIVLVTASGAFTSVTAERTATVDVADDSSAYLALNPNGSSANGQQYASTSGGEVVIDLAASGNSGSGVNVNANTTLDHLINITNQGTQQVDVTISVSGTNSAAVTFYEGETTTAGEAPNDLESAPVTLNTGEQIDVGVHIDSAGLSTGTNQIDLTVTVTAEEA